MSNKTLFVRLVFIGIAAILLLQFLAMLAGALINIAVYVALFLLLIWFVRRMQAPRDRTKGRSQGQYVADMAMKRAGYVPGEGNAVRLEDLGILAYHGDATPDVCRVHSIPATSTHLRPYMQVIQPLSAGGLPTFGKPVTLRFELADEKGKVRFSSEVRKMLKVGKNLVTPPTWLPLSGHKDRAQWSLTVSIGGQAVGKHLFRVRAGDYGHSIARLSEDGEISEGLVGEIVAQDQDEDVISLAALLKDG